METYDGPIESSQKSRKRECKLALARALGHAPEPREALAELQLERGRMSGFCGCDAANRLEQLPPVHGLDRAASEPTLSLDSDIVLS